MSSSEEAAFGYILEDVAIVICQEAKGGWKSSADGVDLEFDDNGNRTVMQIKSGVNWGNSSQRKKLVADFHSATRTLRQGKGMQVRPVEGICYGPSGIKDYGSHIRLVGNAFWEDISGWPHTGRAVLKIVGDHASNGLTESTRQARRSVVAYLHRSGAENDHQIDWDRLYDLIMMPTKERPK